jgi:Nucleotidyltransferase domain
LNVLMWTNDADADVLLSLLVDGQRRILGVDLVGSYLFGSAARGAFEPGSSDLDTVAVLRSDPTETQLTGLEELRAGIVHEMPEWDDPVEAVYLSTHALTNFRTTSPAGADIPQRTLPSD